MAEAIAGGTAAFQSVGDLQALRVIIRPMKTKLILLAITFLLATSAAFSQGTEPQITVREFYTYSNARSSTFNRRHVELRKKWYTAELYKALIAQVDEDAAYLKKNPTDKPYFGDGLTFRPLDEPCQVGERSYKRVQNVGRTEILNSAATVDVSFAYPKACVPAIAPVVYKVNLKRVGGKWLIDDWTYDDGSTLVGEMKKVNY